MDSRNWYFIEVNPRIQVEHTVTEMVTGIDLVRSQILIAQGHNLHEAPLSLPTQEKMPLYGAALQCRVTTEDPENNFAPDYGKISTYRSPAGFGIRLDGGTAYAGAVITPYYDSLLVKMTAWGHDFRQACQRMDRALREFRIRGVKTNIPFLENVVNHPRFPRRPGHHRVARRVAGAVPLPAARDRATKLLSYLGDVIVNGNPEVKGKPSAGGHCGARRFPPHEHRAAGRHAPAVAKARAEEDSPQWARKEKRLLLTDTTFRDAHQSLLATRVRTLRHAGHRARRGPAPAESFQPGNVGRRDVRHRHAVSARGSLAAAARTARADSQHLFPDAAARGQRRRLHLLSGQRDRRVCARSPRAGHRHLPHLRFAQLHRKHARLHRRGAGNRRGLRSRPSATPATSSIRRRAEIFARSITSRMAKELEKLGAHFLAIKDMAGLCRPYAAYVLVKALREEIGIPVHFHTHDTSGINSASILKAADAGVDVADAAIAAMSGGTSQPNLNSLVEALRHTPRDTGSSTSPRSTSAPIIGKRSAVTICPSIRGRKRGLRAALRARNSRRAIHQPARTGRPPWVSATAGAKWNGPTRK